MVKMADKSQHIRITWFPRYFLRTLEIGWAWRSVCAISATTASRIWRFKMQCQKTQSQKECLGNANQINHPEYVLLQHIAMGFQIWPCNSIAIPLLICSLSHSEVASSRQPTLSGFQQGPIKPSFRRTGAGGSEPDANLLLVPTTTFGFQVLRATVPLLSNLRLALQSV